MKTLEELLIALRDESTTPGELKELEALLADPAARQQLYEEFQATATIAEALKLTAPAANNHPSPQPRNVNWVRVLMPAAAVLLVVTGVVTWYWSTKTADSFQIVSGAAVVDQKLNGPIHDGSVIECPAGKSVTLTFPDRSTMELGGSSVAVVHARRVELKSGTGTFQAGKPVAGVEPLRVETSLGSLVLTDSKVRVGLEPKQENPRGGAEMKSAAVILTVAVLAGSVRVDVNGSGYALAAGQTQAFGGEDAAAPVLPKELKGFSGIVSGTVASADKGSFVLKLGTASKKNESKPFEKAALAGKEIVVVTKDVKEMPELATDDVVYVNVSEADGQLVATTVFKAKPKTIKKQGDF